MSAKAQNQVVADDVGAKEYTQDWIRTAQLRLDGSSYPALRRLRCRFDDGRLVIQGQVNTYFQKQLAQAALSDFRDVEIVNEAEVVNALSDSMSDPDAI